jgi:hypothetical protein
MKRLVAIALIAPFAAIAQAPNMRPGLWEITMTNEMPGMPAAAQKPFVSRSCVKPEQAKDPQQVLPRDARSKGETTDYKTVGNTATWKMSCTGEQAAKGTGKITWRGDSYEGLNVIEMGQGGQTMTMSQKYVGRRVGDC